MKFSGMVGYKVQEEVAPGIWQNRIVERKCKGDVIQTAWHTQAAATTINDNAKLNVQIEIVADGYAWAHYGNIVYVVYENSKWAVSAIQLRRPRIILNFGSLYSELEQEVDDDGPTGGEEAGASDET